MMGQPGAPASAAEPSACPAPTPPPPPARRAAAGTAPGRPLPDPQAFVAVSGGLTERSQLTLRPGEDIHGRHSLPASDLLSRPPCAHVRRGSSKSCFSDLTGGAFPPPSSPCPPPAPSQGPPAAGPQPRPAPSPAGLAARGPGVRRRRAFPGQEGRSHPGPAAEPRGSAPPGALPPGRGAGGVQPPRALVLEAALWRPLH